ncbi:PREDICTED: INO80 complex subunit B-like isoform X1 [Amphimedon queenslandica]|uniref:INO80 complex subunit B-like conserved region domain-containing protein n=1 Tax=Amphimedon queenslandica TaxID=400682 RepID=A0A1X7VJV9_AMPQE|nr:PREDICTED: INO80 complex subunit B-like isoform X1 [Amphimedon queenslandica]|eukprot:XP_003384124.2 PREDICTED: INO80 complex subunit B-like isoform X1 [Amphimedon queenslandica]
MYISHQGNLTPHEEEEEIKVVLMGRKRKREQEPAQEEEPSSLKKKRVKKVKKKRHVEKQAIVEDEEASVSITDDESQQALPLSATSSHRPLTLKIKLGSNELLTTTEDRVSIGTGPSISNYGDEWVGGSDDISPGDGDGRDISFQFSGEEEIEEDEEEAWLVALETGMVNERGYLPQAKDPNAMTARQRSMLGSKEEELLELPLMKMKSDEIESEEMLLKKTERNKKRRLQAIKRREKHKADTVQKLLQKQSTKKKDDDKKQAPQVLGPHIRYYDHVTKGTSLSVTPGLQFPIHRPVSSPLPPPARPLCSVCSSNPKRYSDSKTNQPLCSLQCYRRLQVH